VCAGAVRPGAALPKTLLDSGFEGPRWVRPETPGGKGVVSAGAMLAGVWLDPGSAAAAQERLLRPVRWGAFAGGGRLVLVLLGLDTGIK